MIEVIPDFDGREPARHRFEFRGAASWAAYWNFCPPSTPTGATVCRFTLCTRTGFCAAVAETLAHGSTPASGVIGERSWRLSASYGVSAPLDDAVDMKLTAS
jgi:hypothetical protein